MNTGTKAVVGSGPISDLHREAAERLFRIAYQPEREPRLETPGMTGLFRAEEVQPGLLVCGLDLTYLQDIDLAIPIERSLNCMVLLDGGSEPFHIEGYPVMTYAPKLAEIHGFGEKLLCRSAPTRGLRKRTFGITVKPHFLDRFGGAMTNGDLAVLDDFLRPGFHRMTLPWRPKIIETANDFLAHPYGGALSTLFHETQALRFLMEVVLALRERKRPNRDMAHVQFERACRAREILDRSLVTPPKALELAKEVGVNLTTLQADFKAIFGTTIFGYVRSQRLEMGRVLILEHGMRVTDAGFKVGFSNPAAFTAAYRKHFGHPPSVDQQLR